MRDNCPFCKSKNIQLYDEYAYEKEQEANKMEEIRIANNIELSPEHSDIRAKLDDLLDQMKDYDPLDDEDYLKELEERGRDFICLDCSFDFFEKDDYSEYDNFTPTRLTEEEFFQLILDKTSAFAGESPINERVLQFTISLAKNSTRVFYKEMAEKYVDGLFFARRRSEEDKLIEEVGSS